MPVFFYPFEYFYSKVLRICAHLVEYKYLVKNILGKY